MPIATAAPRVLASSETREIGVAMEVWRLAWPAIGHMLLLTLVFAVDRLVLGRSHTDALASLQISTVFVWTVTSIFTAFSTGTLAVAGRAFGAGDRPRAARAALASLALALVLGALVAGASLFASATLLPVAFPNAGEGVLLETRRYLTIVLPALPLAFVEAIAAASLQASGDTRTPLVAAAVSNVLNLVLSCVLVFGLFGMPALGVQGAAIGAVAAMLLQAAFLVEALWSKDSPLPIRDAVSGGLRAFFDGSVVKPLLRVSTPAFADKLVYAGGYLAFVVLIGWLGPASMAANQALSSVEAICFLTAEGFGIAAGSLVAQSLGAGKRERAASIARVSALMAVSSLGVFALAFLAWPRQLLGVFTEDGKVLGLASTSLVIAAVSQPFMAYATVTRMALRGAGATGRVLVVTLVGTFLVRLPLASLTTLAWGWGLSGVWIATTLDWMVQAAMLGWMVHRGRWIKASP